MILSGHKMQYFNDLLLNSISEELWTILDQKCYISDLLHHHKLCLNRVRENKLEIQKKSKFQNYNSYFNFSPL